VRNHVHPAHSQDSNARKRGLLYAHFTARQPALAPPLPLKLPFAWYWLLQSRRSAGLQALQAAFQSPVIERLALAICSLK
jgi:hypothetical protein